jgi:predicted metalloprotease with PDZ domain
MFRRKTGWDANSKFYQFIPNMILQNSLLFCSVMLVAFASAQQVPKELLEGLSSDEFKQREASQLEIQKWADANGEVGIKAIYKIYSESDDPEVISRCLVVLRKLSEKDYMSDGKGYLGVRLAEENLLVPGEEKAQIGIRIITVMQGSQAEVAGIKAGDVIVSMDGKKWHEPGAINEFTNTVSSYKPLRKVVFEIKRPGEEKLLEIPVILGKRPVENLDEMYYRPMEDLEKMARDRHFEEWLNKQKKK